MTTKKKRPSKKRATKKRATKKRATKKRATKRTTKRAPAKRKPAKKRTTKKRATPKRTTKKRTTKRAPAKRKPAKKRTTKKRRKNPAQRVDGVTFKIAGRTPNPETVNKAMPIVLRELKTYEPMKVTDTRTFFPWLVRRMNKLDVGDLVLLHALVELAEAGKVKLYVDEDRRKVMSRADLSLCPTMGDAAEPLIWVTV